MADLMKTDFNAEPNKSFDEAYEDRNLLALLCAVIADSAGYTVGIEPEPEDPEWPVLYIDLEQASQISYHLPQKLVDEFPLLPRYRIRTWDGHSTGEKRQRIRRFIHKMLAVFYDDETEQVQPPTP